MPALSQRPGALPGRAALCGLCGRSVGRRKHEVAMTPAEKLAARKPWRRQPRNGVAVRRTVWRCRLREVRESLRISLRDVAKECGFSVSALWQVEMGGDPMLTTARKLAAFFGKSVEELWPKKKT